MKGIAHFLTGLAVATCFREVVQQACLGSLLPLVGGIAGLLPDTLDFKLLRYFERYDLEIDPGTDLDPLRIAEQLAEIMRDASVTGRRRKVLLRTVRLGADAWRQYRVRFDPVVDEVQVCIGPTVSTAQIPLPGSVAGGCGSVPLGLLLAVESPVEVIVDVFNGPSLAFVPERERIALHFLDWHRRWTHSFAFAVLLGMAVGGAFWLVKRLESGMPLASPMLSGLVVTLAVLVHILFDQMGHMGSNLFYPFSRRRILGLRWFHSSDAFPNFAAVWGSAWLILFNLARFSNSPQPAGWLFWCVGAGLPLAVAGALALWTYRRRRPEQVTATEVPLQQDLLAEMEDSEGLS